MTAGLRSEDIEYLLSGSFLLGGFDWESRYGEGFNIGGVAHVYEYTDGLRELDPESLLVIVDQLILSKENEI